MAGEKFYFRISLHSSQQLGLKYPPLPNSPLCKVIRVFPCTLMKMENIIVKYLYTYIHVVIFEKFEKWSSQNYLCRNRNKLYLMKKKIDDHSIFTCFQRILIIRIFLPTTRLNENNIVIHIIHLLKKSIEFLFNLGFWIVQCTYYNYV